MLNPTFGLPCSWKRMMTLLNLLILAHAEKLRLLETQTWGTSNRERSYSLKGKGTTDAMFHLFGHPNPLFFLQYQMADSSPQQTRSPVWFLEHMNYTIQFVRFLDIVARITLLFKNLVMTKSWKSECVRFQCRLLCFPLHACLPTADSLNCWVDFMQSILVVTIMYDDVAESYKISHCLSSTFEVMIHGTWWCRFSAKRTYFPAFEKSK